MNLVLSLFGEYVVKGFDDCLNKFWEGRNQWRIWWFFSRINTNSGIPERFGGGGMVGKTNSQSAYVSNGGGLSGDFFNTPMFENSLLIAGGGSGGREHTSSIGGDGGGEYGFDGTVTP